MQQRATDRERRTRGAWRRRLVLVLLLLGLAPFAGRSQNDAARSVLEDPFVRSEAKRGLDLLYNMQFTEAAVLFERIDARFPNHPIGPFLLALNTWWKILLDLSDTSHDEAFYAAMDEVIDRSDRLLMQDGDHFDAMFFKGAALGFRGRLRSNRGAWLKAARDGIRAMDYVLGVAEEKPENDDYAFGKGIYDYYAAVVPDRYPFVKPVMVFFPKGNRQRGLRELERTAQDGYYIQTEAAYFLLQIYYLFEQDFDKSVHYASWLREHHPGNAFFHAFEGRVYARWGRWLKARTIFSDVLDRYEAGAPGYAAGTADQALYYLARSYMTYSDYRTALTYLMRLEALTARSPDDTYFKVLGRLRQGMCYDALGQRAIAEARYESVLQMTDYAGAHDRARRYLMTPFGQ